MTTDTLTLSEFLLARLAEDAYAVMLHDQAPRMDCLPGSPPAWWQRLAARQEAEVAAKRAIIEAHTRDELDALTGSWELRVLATVYADHPDYDEAWRP